MTENRRTKAVKPAATREQVYIFAKTTIEAGYPEAAAAADCELKSPRGWLRIEQEHHRDAESAQPIWRVPRAAR